MDYVYTLYIWHICYIMFRYILILERRVGYTQRLIFFFKKEKRLTLSMCQSTITIMVVHLCKGLQDLGDEVGCVWFCINTHR